MSVNERAKGHDRDSSIRIYKYESRRDESVSCARVSEIFYTLRREERGRGRRIISGLFVASM